MVEAMLSRRPYIRIAGDDFPREVIRSRFLQLLTILNHAGNRDFNLHDIVLYPVYDRFIDPFFIGIAGQRQALAVGKCKDFLIPQGEPAKVPFVESP